MKLPIFGKFSRLNREFHPKFHPYFWKSKIQDYFKTAGISKWEFHNSPSNCLFSRSWVTLEESYRLKLPRGYSIPKVSTIFKEGVSFNSKNYPHFVNSKYLDYFTTAGISNTGSFKPLLETLCSQGDKTLWRRVTRLKLPRGYQNRGNFKQREFHFYPKITPIFSIPNIQTISQPREF